MERDKHGVDMSRLCDVEATSTISAHNRRGASPFGWSARRWFLIVLHSKRPRSVN